MTEPKIYARYAAAAASAAYTASRHAVYAVKFAAYSVSYTKMADRLIQLLEST